MNKICSLSFFFLMSIAVSSQASHFYVGGDVGMNYLSTTFKRTDNWMGATSASTTSQLSNRSANGDINLGYVKTFETLFLGINAGVTFLNNQSTNNASGQFDNSNYIDGGTVKLNHFYEILGQIGVSLNDTTQLYLNLGAANAPFDFIQFYKFTTQTSITKVTYSKSLWGFDGGVGIKKALSPHFAVNLFIQDIEFPTFSTPEVHGHPLDNIHYRPSLFLGKIGLEYRV